MYSLDTAGKSLPRAIFSFIVAPVMTFAIVYWLSGALVFTGGKPLPAGLEGFWYSLYYSIGIFTGTGSGDLAPQYPFLWLTSLEAITACVLIAVAIGYIVNRLSSP